MARGDNTSISLGRDPVVVTIDEFRPDIDGKGYENSKGGEFWFLNGELDGEKVGIYVDPAMRDKILDQGIVEGDTVECWREGRENMVEKTEGGGGRRQRSSRQSSRPSGGRSRGGSSRSSRSRSSDSSRSRGRDDARGSRRESSGGRQSAPSGHFTDKWVRSNTPEVMDDPKAPQADILQRVLKGDVGTEMMEQAVSLTRHGSEDDATLDPQAVQACFATLMILWQNLGCPMTPMERVRSVSEPMREREPGEDDDIGDDDDIPFD